MAYERSIVEGALWRKKVDSSLFEYNVTTLPTWICSQWKVARYFEDCSSFEDPRSKVEIAFGKSVYAGWVTVARHGRSSPAYRLWFDEDLLAALKTTFSMSYMRHLEAKLRAANSGSPDKKKEVKSALAVEEEIPFWEFLDIEYAASKRRFRFSAHYKQKPTFPLLFKNLQGQPSLRVLEDALLKGPRARIHKTKWLKRNELELQIGARNVIYYLLDSKKKLIYIGEAKDLVKRLKQPYSAMGAI